MQRNTLFEIPHDNMMLIVPRSLRKVLLSSPPSSSSSSAAAAVATPFVLLLLIINFISITAAANHNNDQAVVYRWASCGGGWRAMFTNVGVANAMVRAGISFDNTISNDREDDEEKDLTREKGGTRSVQPTITGMSSTSGASWFSTQFFYSQSFYDIVTNLNFDFDADESKKSAAAAGNKANEEREEEEYGSINDGIVENNTTDSSFDASSSSSSSSLSDFVTTWMDSYLKLTATILAKNNTECILPGAEVNDGEDAITNPAQQWCIIIRYYSGDWAAFVSDMLEKAVESYEETTTTTTMNEEEEEIETKQQQDLIKQFPYRDASPENRIPPMINTDMIIQSSLSPMSRTSSTNGSGFVYLGPTSLPATTTTTNTTITATGDDADKQHQRQNQEQPKDENDQQICFATMLPTAYTVSSQMGANFYIGNWSSNDVTTYYDDDSSSSSSSVLETTAEASSFSLDQYSNYYLYDDTMEEGNINSEQTKASMPSIFTTPMASLSSAAAPASGTTISALVEDGNDDDDDDSTTIVRGKLNVPFSRVVTSDSNPKLGQIASISSASLGTMSGLNPSVLAQQASKKLYTSIVNTTTTAERKVKEIAYNKALNVLYNDDGLWGVSVCSQWPNQCNEYDSRFSDGAYTDNPAFPMNVAHYQRTIRTSSSSSSSSMSSGTDTDPLSSSDNGVVLKFVLINPNSITPDNNFTTYNDAIIMGYYNTSFNKLIDPGEYIWSPGQPVPWPSTQIFEEYVTEEDYHSKFEIVDGTNFTVAILSGTTIDNAVYGVEGGQKIELFYMMINSFIPSKIIGTDDIVKYTPKLAELTTEIASNTDLQKRLKQFFSIIDDDDDTNTDTTNNINNASTVETAESSTAITDTTSSSSTDLTATTTPLDDTSSISNSSSASFSSTSFPPTVTAAATATLLLLYL